MFELPVKKFVLSLDCLEGSDFQETRQAKSTSRSRQIKLWLQPITPETYKSASGDDELIRHSSGPFGMMCALLLCESPGSKGKQGWNEAATNMLVS